MNTFDAVCKAHGGEQVGLNADWCVSTYKMGEIKDADVLIHDNEDGTYTLRLWDSKEYMNKGYTQEAFESASEREYTTEDINDIIYVMQKILKGH